MSIVIKKETAASIPTPASSKTAIFVETADGLLKQKDDTGTVSALGAVSSFNGRTGAIIPVAGDYIASEITNTPSGGIAATDVQAAINELDTEKLAASHAGTGGSAHAAATDTVDGFMAAADKAKLDGIEAGATANLSNTALLDRDNHTGSQNASTVIGSASFLAWFNSAGELASAPGHALDNTSGGLNQYLNYHPNDAGGFGINPAYVGFDPLQDSDNDAYNVYAPQVEFDVNSSGFSQGANGEAASIFSPYFRHVGTGDIGAFTFFKSTFEMGNGTDPIDIRGMSYSFGFGNFNDGVNISGPVQGYGFQPNASSGVTMDSGTYVTAFYDSANFQTAVPGWTSMSMSPQIAEVQNNFNYNGASFNPTITNFDGNAGAYVIGVYGNFGTFDTGGFTGIQVNPNVASVTNATGLYINMGNVTASGTKRAIDVVGDVNIQGSLAFTGSLSMGQLSAFYSSNPVDGGGNPQNMHGLTTEMIALNGVTTANADAIGVTTAMLIRLEANSISTSGPFGLGFTALALPCVVETHTGATLDFMSGATYALNLIGTSTGGTIDRVNLCRSVAIPNGITTINELVGFLAHAPFGDVGTDSWGFYSESAGANNFFRNLVKIGSGGDKPSAGQALEVVGTVQLNGNIGFFGTTEASQQTGGAATAGVVYTSTEQAMIQTVYDALRTYGLLS